MSVFIAVPEMAKQAGVDIRTLRRWLGSGKLKVRVAAWKHSKSMFVRADFEKWLAEKKERETQNV